MKKPGNRQKQEKVRISRITGWAVRSPYGCTVVARFGCRFADPLNHMAGGKASGVIRPVTNIVSRLLSFCRPHRDWASGLSLQDRCWFDKIAKTQS
jgi:hypothetical protein